MRHSDSVKLTRGLMIFLVVALSVITLNVLGFAQSESGGGAIHGTVKTPDGQPVANALVSIRNTETGYLRLAVTKEKGQFTAPAMPVGTYHVQAKQDQHSSELMETHVTVGNTQSVKLYIDLGGEAQKMVVNIAPSLIDAKETSLSSSVAMRSINDAPIRGRSFPDFVQLTPDVVQETDKNGLVISGQRSINSNVAVDGADFNDPLQGNQRGGNDPVFFFPLSAVREFQVVQAGAGAEVGRTSAGFVNAVTQSGTNDVHSDLFYLNRNSTLTSPDAFGVAADNTQHQFGGTVGGPIKKDRAFFFLAAERNSLTVPFTVQFDPQPAGVVLPDSLLALQGNSDGTNNTTSMFARTDIILSARHVASLDYNFADLSANNFGFIARPLDQAESANYGRYGSSNAFKGSLVSIINANVINELRGQAATDYRHESQNVPSAMVVIAGVGTIGADGSRPRLFNNTRYEMADNISVTRSRHALRFGVDGNVDPEKMQRELNISGRYDFSSLANFNAGKIARYRGTVPTGSPNDLFYRGTQHEAAFFVQDKISLAHNLTVNAGVRWEGQWNPQPKNPNPALPLTARVPDDLKQWQPRLGIAWDPQGTGRTVIRISSGLYDARTPGILLQRAFTDNGLNSAVLDSKTDPNILVFVSYPNPLTVVPAGIKTTPSKVVGFDPDFRNPRSLQASISIETALSPSYTMSLGYTRNSTWALQRRLDTNLFDPTFDATGMPIFPKVRPNPAVGPYSINQSKAHSTYDAFDLSLRKKMTRYLQFQAGYTLAWNRDDDTQERVFDRETTLNPLDPSLENGWSKNDVRHNVRLSGTTNLPHGFSISAITLAHSGFPFTPVIGFDTQNDGNDANDRAIINGRVAGRTSMRMDPFFDMDMRILKTFQISERSRVNFFTEFFNITRNTNKNYGPDSVSNFGTPAAPNPTAGLALFAPLTTRFGGTRQVQLGVRYSF
jgi:hypothetical protein